MMSGRRLGPPEIERIATVLFARVRGDALTLGVRGNVGVDLEVVPNQARAESFGITLMLRLIVYEGNAVRDVKEQDVLAVPTGADEEKLSDFFAGIALGIRARMAAGAQVETFMPHEFVPSWTLMDPARRTVSDFAAAVLASESAAASGDDIDDLSATKPIAVNPEFEEAIAADPEKIENCVVYADWLSERGDPRGELITCSLPDAPANARRRIGALLAEHAQYFTGNLLTGGRGEFIRVDWALGWIRSARVASCYELYAEDPDFVAKALRALLALHSARLLRGLTLGCFDFEDENNYDALYPILAEAGPRPSLRTLFIGDTHRGEQQLSSTSAGKLSAIRGLYPNLRELKIRAGSMTLDGALEYPKLESLILESGGLGARSVSAVAKAPLPELRHLEIWTGSRNYGATSTTDDVLPILDGESLPKLASLALRNSEYTDEICRELVRAPILERLTSLDLSLGWMTDAGVDFLLSARPRFARLKTLEVSDNFLSEAGIAALRGLGPHIDVRSEAQKEAEGPEWRYVSVGE